MTSTAKVQALWLTYNRFDLMIIPKYQFNLSNIQEHILLTLLYSFHVHHPDSDDTVITNLGNQDRRDSRNIRQSLVRGCSRSVLVY